MAEQGSCCQTGCPNDCMNGYLFCRSCQDIFVPPKPPATPIPAWLEELERLHRVATRGKWNDRRLGSLGNGLPRSHEEQVCNRDGVAVFIVTHDGGADGNANVALTCAMRNALPELLSLARKHYGGEP